MGISEDKSRIRTEIKLKLKDIKNRDKRSQGLVDSVVNMDLLKDVQFVSIFLSMQDEIDTQPILDYCWGKSIVVCVPEHVSGDEEKIMMREYVKDGELHETDLGIMHPKYGPFHLLDEIELIFVPGLAFTIDGGRLGRGGGFYDKLLSLCDGKFVGLCYKEQILEKIPLEKHDHNVNVVISA